MNAAVAQRGRRAALAGPAIALTLISAVLTVAVVVLWLGPVMPVALALVVGLGYDGAWLTALAYERRLAAQGDHDRRVTLVGWAMGLLAAAMLVAHALTADKGMAGWLAVSWLPLAAKSTWWLHGVWERTEISPAARREISRVLQTSRDSAALARATLTAQTGVEETRLRTLASTGGRVARATARAGAALSGAWAELAEAGSGDAAPALEAIAAPVATAGQIRWDMPVWTPIGDVRPEITSASAERVPPQVSPVTPRVSNAQAVQHLVSTEGVSDPKELLNRMPEVTGRPVTNTASIMREFRAARRAVQSQTPAAQPQSQPFGFTTTTQQGS